jgi:hypothetical protein
MSLNVSTLCTRYILQLEKDWLAEDNVRYTPFDHEELARVACEAMNARNCTLIENWKRVCLTYFSSGSCAHLLMAYGVLQQGFSPDFG